ncbi:MAG: formylglycine-generating enzyme family protein [Myxococcota bacterium]
MAFVPGGTFRFGANDTYAEERAAEQVRVEALCIGVHEVTNAEFRRFVEATGYVTIAERELPSDAFGSLPRELRAAGAMVFRPVPAGQPVPELGWWHWVPGASWRFPGGPATTLDGLDAHPVVQVAFEDAVAFARWSGGSLPTEAQWEYAARGGLDGAAYPWGDAYVPGRHNVWQGAFPWANTREDGFEGTAPVGSFAPNGFGLYDMTGNVWEWTSDWYRPGHDGAGGRVDPSLTDVTAAYDPSEPSVAKHVVKGGSFLCSPDYCGRYRPAARQPQEPDTGMSHIGFRIVRAPVPATNSGGMP